MPHAELKYSADLKIDAKGILKGIEQVILEHDPASGECKGRAYPAAEFHHTHVLISISMLKKPHRDEAFTNAVIKAVEAFVKGHLKQDCFFSLGISYSDGGYITNEFKA